MQLSVVINSISLIGMMIIIGVILGRYTPINENTKKVYTLLIVNIAMPCIILSSIFKVTIDQSMLRNIGIVFLLSIFINLIGMSVGWFIASRSQKSSKLKQEIALLSGLGNTGFIGIPLCAAILGPEGALYAAIFDAGVDFTIWTFGVMVLNKSYSFSINTLKSLINIPIIAIVMGLTFAFINFKPPEITIELINQLAALASPLAMFYIGLLIMSKNKQTTVHRSNQFIPVVTKLIVLPMITLILVNILPLKIGLLTKQVLLIQSMMPALTLSPILFTKYNKNDVYGAFVTILTTLLCLVTIPFLIWIFNNQNFM